MFEIESIVPAPRDPAIRGFAVDGPRPGQDIDADSLEIDGWAVGEDAPLRAIEVLVDGERRSRVPVERERPDVGAAFPDRPWAGTSGYRGWVPLAGLDRGGTLTLLAETAAGERASVAEIVLRPLALAADEATDWAGPDFLVIGAQRSGSTSLYTYLTSHPNIAPARIKEVKYFSAFADRPWGWYRRQFPDALPPGTITGEATPYYLFHPHAPRRVARRLPNVRLIAVLRDPVARAYSHWAHETARGTEWLPFADALAAEPERLAGERERMLADERFASVAHQNHSYAGRGRYAEQLADWFAHVDRDRLLVLRAEDLFADPARTVRQATAFLGVPPAPLLDARQHNERAYPPLDPALRRRLAAAFAPANRDLEDLLGRRFDWNDDR